MGFSIFSKKGNNEDRESNKERFNRIIKLLDETAYRYQNNKSQAASYMIQVIVEGMNHYEAMLALQYESLELSNETAHQNNSYILEIYRNIAHEMFPGEIIRFTPVDMEIEINSIPILLNTWKGDCVIDNLININEENVFDCKTYSWNIDNTYIKPLSIAVCNCGNHSQYAARYKNQRVTTVIKNEFDLNELYECVRFDGEGFLNQKTSEHIELMYDKEIVFYAGVLFELGRYLLC